MGTSQVNIWCVYEVLSMMNANTGYVFNLLHFLSASWYESEYVDVEVRLLKSNHCFISLDILWLRGGHFDSWQMSVSAAEEATCSFQCKQCGEKANKETTVPEEDKLSIGRFYPLEASQRRSSTLRLNLSGGANTLINHLAKRLINCAHMCRLARVSGFR